MPKKKTHKGLTKRFKVTGSGKKLTARKPNASHLLSHMSGKRKRQLRRDLVIASPTLVSKMRREMGK